jgi:hemerythrin-like domain-containing protein
MTTPKPTGHIDEPIQDFSQCHAGILNKLQMLGELPALLEPAARAREVAGQALEFFRDAVFEHHIDEERELFPAVLASATQGDEHDLVQLMVDRLTKQHRELEGLWKRLEPGLRKVAKGQPSDVSVEKIEQLVTQYRAHAEFEEREFLPLSQAILGRNANHLSALGLSLHMRHTPSPVKGYV